MTTEDHPHHPYEPWMYEAGRIAGMHPADVDPATYSYVITVNSEPSGRRSGRRGTKIDRAAAMQIEALWRDLDDQGKPRRSLAEIADWLNTRDQVPPRPGRADQPWNAAAIKSFLFTLRNQQLTLLVRLGSLIAAVAQRHGVSPAEFRRLAMDHQIEPYWIWDRFLPESFSKRQVDFTTTIASFAPPFGPLDDRIVVYPAGWRVADLYRQIHETEPETQDVLYAMRDHDWAMSPEVLYRVCDRLNVSFDMMIGIGLLKLDAATNTFQATPESQRMGQRWSLIASPDESSRWDSGYQPTPEERATLPPDWDWDDRPVTWHAEFSDIRSPS